MSYHPPSDLVSWYNENAEPTFDGRQHPDRTELDLMLDECFENLPVDLTEIISMIPTSSHLFLQNNILDRLLVAVLNEEDGRISPLTTKYQLIALFKLVVKASRKVKIRLRLAIQLIAVWIDELSADQFIELDIDTKLIQEIKKLFLFLWRIDPLIGKSLVDNIPNEITLKQSLHVILQHYAVIQVQAVLRSHLARKHLHHELQKAKDDQFEEVKKWSILILQKIARGYIARKTTVRAMRIRKQLSKEVLRITEKFLTSGDLWGFLAEINEELNRLKKDLQWNSEREDNWASQFVQHVIQNRQDEFNTAWDRFPAALNDQIQKKRGTGPLQGTSSIDTLSQQPMLQSAVGSILGKSLTTGSSIELEAPSKRSTSPSLAKQSSTTKPLSSSSSMKRHPARHEITLEDVSRALGNSQAEDSTGFEGSRRDVAGPMLRKALQTTVELEVTEKLNHLVNGHFRTRKLAQEMRAVYEPHSHIDPPKKGKKDISRGSEPVKLTPSPRKKKGLNGHQVQGTSKIKAMQEDWLTKNTIDTSEGEEEENKVQPGNSLLLDIPMGIEDTIERLLHASALRCFVPDFFQGIRKTTPEKERKSLNSNDTKAESNDQTIDLDDESDISVSSKRSKANKSNELSAKESYEMYLRMPMGLAKMRYELECKKWSQGVINRLRIKGLQYIQDIAPISKMIMSLKSVEAPQVLINQAIDIFLILKKIGKIVPLGMTSKTVASSANESLEILTDDKKLDDKRSVSRGASRGTSRGASRSASRSASPSTRPSPKKKTITFEDQIQEVTTETSSDLNFNEAKTNKSQNKENNTEEKGYQFIDYQEVEAQRKHDAAMEEAGKMLKQMLEAVHEDWCQLHGSVEDIFLQAAFLVVPHRARDEISRTKVLQGDEHAMGNHAFKAYVVDLLALTNDTEKEDFIRSRFRSSVILTTPFTLYLKSRGVNTVKELLDVDLEDLQLPPALQTQLEVLMNIIINQQVNSKLLPIPRDYKKASSTEYMVPMYYDSKFQRTPLDPYGHPPVFGKLKPKRHLRREEALQNMHLDAKNSVDMIHSSLEISYEMDKPMSLWEQTKSSPIIDRSSLDGESTWSFKPKKDGFHEEGMPSVTKTNEQSLSTSKSAEPLGKLRTSKGKGKKPSSSSSSNHKASKEKDEPSFYNTKDFITMNTNLIHSVFKETYICKHPRCGQVFSRLYTYKVHLKSHEILPEYHSFKRDAQLYLDHAPTALKTTSTAMF